MRRINTPLFAGGNPVSGIEWDGHYSCTATCEADEPKQVMGGAVLHNLQTPAGRADYALAASQPILAEMRKVASVPFNTLGYDFKLLGQPSQRERDLAALEGERLELKAQMQEYAIADRAQTLAAFEPEAPSILDYATVLFDPTDPIDLGATAASVLGGSGLGAKAGSVGRKLDNLAHASKLTGLAAKVYSQAERGLSKARGALSSLRSRIAGLRSVGSGNASPGRIVIGRNMRERVIPYARQTDAGYYAGTPSWLRWLPQSAQVGINRWWLRRKIGKGYGIDDLGPDPASPWRRSPFYEGEHRTLGAHGYPNYRRIDPGY